jgi:hypothetical protein
MEGRGFKGMEDGGCKGMEGRGFKGMEDGGRVCHPGGLRPPARRWMPGRVEASTRTWAGMLEQGDPPGLKWKVYKGL